MPVWLVTILLVLATACIILPVLAARTLARVDGWEKAILYGLLIAGPGIGMWIGFLLAWYWS